MLQAVSVIKLTQAILNRERWRSCKGLMRHLARRGLSKYFKTQNDKLRKQALPENKSPKKI